MERNRRQRQRCLQFGRHVDVGPRRLGLAAWMVVDEDHCFGVMPQGCIDDLAHIHGRLFDRAAGQYFLGNQPVTVVELQDHEMLDRFMCQPSHAEMLNPAPACQDMAVLDIGMAQVKPRRFDDLQGCGRGIASAASLGKKRGRCPEHC